MRVVLIIPDGIMIRNYLYSNFINELENQGFEIFVLYQIPQFAIEEIKLIKPSIKEFHPIPHFTEPVIARTIRELCVYARLSYNKKLFKNDTIMWFWSKNNKGFKRKFLALVSENLGYLFSKSYSSILFLEKVYDKMMTKTSIYQTVGDSIKKINPDLVLNLHQRSITSSPIINYCNSNKIDTATMIFSWDNVPKARLISRYKYYFTWSELMKSELLTAYSEIKEEQIFVTGSPQFEFYFDKNNQMSKEDFFKEFNLDVTKKTICFSSNDTSSPYEANYFNDICEEIDAIDSLQKPQIIFRKNPVDHSNRFDQILEKYAHLITPIEPDWRYEDSVVKHFSSVLPTLNDNRLLVNTVKHSDVVINLGSTMAHDFAVMDKPCLYLNYDPVEKSKFPVEEVYQFQHFRSMKNLNAVVWINAKNEISKKVLEALNQPETIATDRKKWMEIVVKHPLEKCSFNIVSELKKICTSV